MTENRLEVQQTQKLSQGLQTVIHLLSLDLDGLSEYMLRAVQENPALEYVPPQKVRPGLRHAGQDPLPRQSRRLPRTRRWRPPRRRPPWRTWSSSCG